MQISYLPVIQQLSDEIETLNEKLNRVENTLKDTKNREMRVKIFRVGDPRSLLYFLSDPTVRLKEIKLIGILSESSAKDFEVCLIYEIDSEKKSMNNFQMFLNANHVIENKINSILDNPSVCNWFIETFTTYDHRSFVLFWEESVADTPLDGDEQAE
jgi:hypothetical protein